MLSGWIVANKPLYLSSAQVVGIIKRKLQNATQSKIKIGHTGTLDPFATGVLPLAIGEATKLSQILVDSKKSYEFTLLWGEKTDTGDIEGKIVGRSKNIPTYNDLMTAVQHFIGEQNQIPPKYSALKINGIRAYSLARQDIDFELEKRVIHIYDLKLLEHDIANKKSFFYVLCSKGTYIRTLGESIAEKCNSVGHLIQLNRTKVGFFSLQNAIFPDICEKIMYKSILGITKPLSGISAIFVNHSQAQELRFGRSIIWHENFPTNEIFPVIDQENDKQIIALASYSNQMIIPKRIFNI